MKSTRESVDDLLVLARRGSLSDGDERSLRDMLDAAPESRVLYEAGRAFDKEAPVMPGDDELIARIAERVQARLDAAGTGKQVTTKKKRRWVAQVALAAALVAGVSIGANEIAKRSASTSAPTLSASAPANASIPTVIAPSANATLPKSTSQEPSPETTNVGPTPSSTPEPTSVAPAPSSVPRAAPQPTNDPRLVQSTPSASASGAMTTNAPSASSSAAEPTASALFAAANQARVRGDNKEAIRLSQKLEERFPSSNEALITHLSLGVLLLQDNQPEQALAQFRKHRSNGASATMPEALWGESQALHRLGRSKEERAVLQELLDKYPSSAYSSAARKQLSTLE